MPQFGTLARSGGACPWPSAPGEAPVESFRRDNRLALVPPPLRVLIVDDHEVAREGFRAALDEDTRFEIAGLAASGQEAVRRAQRLRPDLAVVDHGLPDISGDEVCRRILAETAGRTRIVLVTSSLSADRIRAAVEAGAYGYVTKAGGLQPLRDVLEEALAAHTLLAAAGPTPAERLLLRTLRGESRPAGDSSLTPRQRRVLELAVEGMTDRQIGDALFVTESTVRYHLQRLKRQLGARSKADLVGRAHRLGILGEPSEPPPAGVDI